LDPLSPILTSVWAIAQDQRVALERVEAGNSWLLRGARRQRSRREIDRIGIGAKMARSAIDLIVVAGERDLAWTIPRPIEADGGRERDAGASAEQEGEECKAHEGCMQGDCGRARDGRLDGWKRVPHAAQQPDGGAGAPYLISEKAESELHDFTSGKWRDP
jgi:hypothetical protein